MLSALSSSSPLPSSSDLATTSSILSTNVDLATIPGLVVAIVATLVTVIFLLKYLGFLDKKADRDKGNLPTDHPTCLVHKEVTTLLGDMREQQKVNNERHEQHKRDFAKGTVEFEAIGRSLIRHGEDLAALREGMDILLERRGQKRNGK